MQTTTASKDCRYNMSLPQMRSISQAASESKARIRRIAAAVLCVLLLAIVPVAAGDEREPQNATGGADLCADQECEAEMNMPLVLLVHGYFGSSAQMKVLRLRLEHDGFDCDDIDFSWFAVRDSIEDYAQELAEKIEVEYADRQEVIVIAHSMGGLITRYYLKNLATTDQVRRVITIATPHHGTESGKLPPSSSTAAQEMIPGSQFLTELNSPTELSGEAEYYAIWTPTDGTVIPAENAIMCGARNYKVTGVGLAHLTLLVSDAVYDLVRAVLSGKDIPVTGPQTADHGRTSLKDRMPSLPWL